MTTIIKLLIAAAILHAVVRAGVSAVSYYELKDSSQQMLVFGGEVTEEELAEGILAKASELALPLDPENLAVHRDGVRTVAEASYVDAVELLPRYRVPINYSFRVEALSLQNAQNPRARTAQ
jgi:hypothetical protein